MQAKLNTMLLTGVLVTACASVILLPAGCQSSDRQVAAAGTASGPTQVCPLCGHETRKHPLTGLKYTTCVCPKCKRVWTVDKETAESIERAFGEEPGFMATVCEGCGVVMQECAVCREARG
jgi:hypothetical protein